MLRSNGSLRVKSSLTFFKVLERRNIQNQYLNYILKIINQNILANPTDILKCASKSSMKNFIPQRLLPKLPLLNLLAKLLIERKYLMNNFIFVRLKFSK